MAWPSSPFSLLLFKPVPHTITLIATPWFPTSLHFNGARILRDTSLRAVNLCPGTGNVEEWFSPRLTLDGGASLLAVGRTLPALAGSSPTSPLSLPTPPTSESNLPAQQETRLEGTSTAPPAAAPNPTMADPMPVSVDRLSSARGSGWLKHLVDWLVHSGAAKKPLKLSGAHDALQKVGLKEYASVTKSQWYTRMLQEAVDAGLIELINTDVEKKVLNVRGEVRMIRLLERGPLVYV
ncbi:hypothetical protein B0H13DRAFT_2554245 [Mycena leptocephala]|nr:hypothetical protein B0H13DRAFT_2554245 [Mycena leptocephala]